MTTLKQSACVKRKRHYLASLISLAPNKTGSGAAVADRGYYWGENERLYGLTPPYLKITIFSRKFRFLHQDITINTDGDEEQWNFEWEGVTRSVTTATVEWTSINFELLSRGAQSVSSFRRHARCIVGKTKDFLDQKLIQASRYFLGHWRFVHAERERDFRTLEQIGISGYPHVT